MFKYNEERLSYSTMFTFSLSRFVAFSISFTIFEVSDSSGGRFRPELEVETCTVPVAGRGTYCCEDEVGEVEEEVGEGDEEMEVKFKAGEEAKLGAERCGIVGLFLREG